jgi:hypothetical protein
MLHVTHASARITASRNEEQVLETQAEPRTAAPRQHSATDQRRATSATSTGILQRARTDPAYAAFLLLRAGFTVLPIVFGLDKFTNLLTDWQAYLAPGSWG